MPKGPTPSKKRKATADPSDIPAWVLWLRNNEEYFNGAVSILEILWHARGGGYLSQFLAGVGAIKGVTDFLYPKVHPWHFMTSIGLYYEEVPLELFLYQELHKRGGSESIPFEDGAHVYIWRDEEGQPCFGFLKEESSVSFFKNPARGDDALRKALEFLWGQNDRLSIRRTGSSGITLAPMEPLGPYLSHQQDVDYWVNRVKAYPPGPRTLLLRGPTGVGKSTLAQHIARGLKRGNGRTLKISGDALNKFSEEDLMGILKWFRPTVLLLDDLELNNPRYTGLFLSVLELLRSPDTLVIVTMMLSGKTADLDPKPGSWHFEGMRPGRIEETITLYLPDEADRALILQHYARSMNFTGFEEDPEMFRQVVEQTVGLSGAFLRAVVERLRTHGTGKFEQEVDLVLYMSPAPDYEPSSRQEEDPEDPDELLEELEDDELLEPKTIRVTLRSTQPPNLR
jgi:DNA polymerase III delta prime subunit